MGENIVIEGIVTPGRSLGRRLGFPTANVPLGAEAAGVAKGVYFAKATIADTGQWYYSLVNIGRRPTVGEGLELLMEAYLIGFEGSLYGEKLRVELLEFIRDEKKFDSLDELRAAMENDLIKAKNIIKTYESGL